MSKCITSIKKIIDKTPNKEFNNLFITNKDLPLLENIYKEYDTYIKEQLNEKSISGLVLEL